MNIVLSKHHGLGNDFLVLDLGQLAGTATGFDWAALARRWCDRGSGIGADGLLLLSSGDSDASQPRRLGMVLHNADGSRAEMSGNGIRCLVQAAHRRLGGGDGDRYAVTTDAGERVVAVLAGSSTDELAVEVEMGEVTDLPEPEGWSALECHPDRPVRHLSLGNPHSVVGVDDVNVVDLARLGALVPHINLEIVAPGPEPDAVTMRVHERGAGLTLACGTGACATAEAAISWGLVPGSSREVVVHMPGGDARVRLDQRRATLVGPATYVGDFVVDIPVDE